MTERTETERGERENCVLCRKPTAYAPETDITQRRYYIPGVGQLCPECYKKMYGNERQYGKIKGRTI